MKSKRKRMRLVLLVTFVVQLTGAFAQNVYEVTVSQCDCLNENLPGLSSVTTPIFCGDLASNGFPNQPGLVQDTIILSNGFLVDGMSPEEADTDHLWVMRWSDLVLSPLGVGLEVYVFIDGDWAVAFNEDTNEYGFLDSAFTGEGSILPAPNDISDAILLFGFFEDDDVDYSIFCIGNTIATIQCSSDVTQNRIVPNTVEMFFSLAEGTLLTFNGLRRETDLSISQNNIESVAKEVASRLILPPVVPSVDESKLVFLAEQNSETNIDLNDVLINPNDEGLMFSIDSTNLPGTFVTPLNASSGRFTYQPVPNFIGKRSFTMEYGVHGNACTNTISLTLVVLSTANKFHDYAFTQCDCRSGKYFGEGSLLTGLNPDGTAETADFSDCGNINFDFPALPGVRFQGDNGLPVGVMLVEDLREDFVMVMKLNVASASTSPFELISGSVAFDLQDGSVFSVTEINGLLTANQNGFNILERNMIYGTDVFVTFGIYEDEFSTVFTFLCIAEFEVNGIQDCTVTGQARINIDTNLILVRSNGFNPTYILKGFRIESGFDIIQPTFIETINEVRNRMATPLVIPPPANPRLEVTGDQGSEISIDLSPTVLSQDPELFFTFEALPIQAEVIGPNGKTIILQPEQSFIGVTELTVNYGITGSECTNSAIISIVITSIPKKTHEFEFTQCDCINNRLIGMGDAISDLSENGSVVPTNVLFDCGPLVSNGFPIDQGVKFLSLPNVFPELIMGQIPIADLAEDYLFMIKVRVDNPNVDATLFIAEDPLLSSPSQIQIIIRNGNIFVTQSQGATLNMPMLFGVDVILIYGFFVDEFGTNIGFLARRSVLEVEDIFVTGGRPKPSVDDLLRFVDLGSNFEFKGFRVETGLDFTQTTFNKDLDAAFNRFTNTPVIPPIDESSLLLFAEEDTESIVDTTPAIPNVSGILFSFNTSGLPGDVNFIDNTSFSYLSVPNFFGDRSFTLEYGVKGSTCTNTVPVTLRINNTNDVPVVNNNLELEVFVGNQVKYRLENIVTDSDFFGNGNKIPSARFQVDSAPTGMVFRSVTSNGDCESNPALEFEISNSSITLCIFTPRLLLLNEDSVQFTIMNDEDITTGSFTVRGIAPVETLTGVSFTALEDTPGIIDPALLINPLIDGDVSIRVTRLPVILRELNFTLNSAVAPTARLQFQPARGAFNAFRIGNALRSFGSDGVPIGNCQSQERDLNGFCPISFSFVAELGDFVSNEETASILIEAVDNLGTSVSLVNNNDQVVDIVAQNSQREATSTIPALQIFSDNGESVFPVELQITSAGAASFNFPSNVQEVEVDNTNFNGIPALDCTLNACTSASLSATPNQLQNFLSNTIITVGLNEPVVFPVLTFQAGDSELQILYDVEIRDSTENGSIQNFFLDETNIVLVTILFLFLAGLITTIVIFSKRIGEVEKIVNNLQQNEESNQLTVKEEA